MEELNKIIGNNLTYLRKKAGLTQSEFGEKFAYSDKTVSKWEQGDVVPNVEVLKAIADYHGVSVDFILKEHTTEEDFFTIVKKIPNSANKIAFAVMIVMLICAIGAVIYIASIFDTGTSDPHINRWWTTFLWVVPVSALFLSAFSKRVFRSKKLVVFWLSVFVWTILLAAFLTFLYKGVYWYLFFIGLPIQIALILMLYIK